jgi:hypothetical protein
MASLRPLAMTSSAALELLRKLLLDGLALGLALGRELVAVLGGTGLSLGLGVGERFFIDRDGRIRLGISAYSAAARSSDSLTCAISQDRGNARQREPCHQKIERNERDREPKKL